MNIQLKDLSHNPVYLQVRQQIEDQIKNKVVSSGEPLPPNEARPETKGVNDHTQLQINTPQQTVNRSAVVCRKISRRYQKYL